MSSNYELSESDDAISQALVSARLSATPLDDFPGEIPESMDQAYAIQSTSMARWPDKVAGWKIGMLAPQYRELHSTERLAGPVFESYVREEPAGSAITLPIFVGGFAAVEAEFVFKLSRAVEPVQREWSDEEIGELVTGLHIGIEIASSPMAEVNNLGPTVVASDFGNNAGLLLGPEIPDWQSLSPEEMPARVMVDGEVVGDASAAGVPGGPVAALRFLLSVSAERGLELPAGSLISTGASTGIHDVVVTSTSRVEFGDYGSFDLSFEPMPSTQ